MTWAGNDNPHQQLAGWWYRVGATVLDGLIVDIPAGILGALTGSRVALYLLVVLAQLTYASLLLSTRGQTVGMMAVGTRCVDQATGANLTLQKALLRTVVATISNIGSVLSFALGAALGLFTLIDILWPLWDSRKQTLHDKAVNSLVVLARAQVGAPPFPQSAPPAYGDPAGGWTTQPGGGWQTAPSAAPPFPPSPPSPSPPPSDGGWQAAPSSPPPFPPSPSSAAPASAPSAAGWQPSPAPPPAWNPAPPAPQQAVAAAWYPDPAGSGGERWWDGRSWTEHTRTSS